MVRPPAAERRKARTGPPGKQPQKVEPAVVALCYIGIPLGLVLFVFGLCGVFVLRDPDQLQWYSQTQLGELWRWLTEKNPFYLTICVNGGVVSAIMLSKILWDHKKAVELEQRLDKGKEAADSKKEK